GPGHTLLVAHGGDPTAGDQRDDSHEHEGDHQLQDRETPAWNTPQGARPTLTNAQEIGTGHRQIHAGDTGRRHHKDIIYTQDVTYRPSRGSRVAVVTENVCVGGSEC